MTVEIRIKMNFMKNILTRIERKKTIMSAEFIFFLFMVIVYWYSIINGYFPPFWIVWKVLVIMVFGLITLNDRIDPNKHEQSSHLKPVNHK